MKYGRSQVYCYAEKREELKKGTLKQLKDKGENSQERDRGSYKSWIENQVRLKAQL